MRPFFRALQFIYRESETEREREMEVAAFHQLNYSHLFPSAHQNYVHWTRTPESHIYSASIPGVRKEEIKVEVEDSRYLVIRTEAEEVQRNFNRKFRLPEQVDVEGISAEYVDGVLTVKVPRSYVRRGFFIHPADRPQPHTVNVLARAA